MRDGKVLVEVCGLCYSYGERQAVRDASFTILEGEIFGFLGPNGAGKTTAISCISGLLADWRGKMRFRDQPFLPARSTADRRRLGFVPQEIALYDELTGRENLEFFASLNGLSAAQRAESVGQALELAGLTERANDRVKQYSGGMKRRLNLVAGDLHQPELLLLDEPTVGVDPQSRNHIFEALFELRKSAPSGYSGDSPRRRPLSHYGFIAVAMCPVRARAASWQRSWH